MSDEAVEPSVSSPDPVVVESAVVAADLPDDQPPAEPSVEHPQPEQTSAKKAVWTQEKRDALSAKMKAKHQSASPPPSPFALTDSHEFPTSPPPSQVYRVDIYSKPAGGEPVPVDSIPVPPPVLPGTSSSPFRRCSCLGVLPGRVCMFCYGTKWIKLCGKCEGEGRVHLNVRKGAERSQPCGHCGGKGTLPANLKEIEVATKLVEEFVSSNPNGHSVVIADPELAEGFRRATRLPGIGVTATKRGGTILARRRDKQRNEKRKTDYARTKGKAVAAK